jgi:hypothetical protein
VFLFALVFGSMIYFAYFNGEAQVRAEYRRAADALRARVAEMGAAGRLESPLSSPLWYAYAALTSVRTIHRAWRGARRGATRAIASGREGALWRIWRAVREGARQGVRHGRDRHRAWRRREPRPPRARTLRMARCDDCGLVFARTALRRILRKADGALGWWLLCAVCLAAAEGGRPAPESGPESAPGPELDPEPEAEPELEGPPPEIRSPDQSGPESGEGAGPDGRALPELPEHSPRQRTEQPEPVTGDTTPNGVLVPVRKRFDLESPMPEDRLGEMPIRRGGQASLPQLWSVPCPRARGGESYTHGQWDAGTRSLADAAADLPRVLDAMLGQLDRSEAGDTQRRLCTAHADMVASLLRALEEMLTDVNRRNVPVVDTVSAAGGPEEIAGIPYLSEA